MNEEMSEAEAVERATRALHQAGARNRELDAQVGDLKRDLELERREVQVMHELLRHVQAERDYFAGRDARVREALANLHTSLGREIERARAEQGPSLAAHIEGIAERQEAEDTARVERVVEGIRRINGGRGHEQGER